MSDTNPSAARSITKIMAIGTLKAPLSAEQQQANMPREVPDTLKLYLDGRIEQWWAKQDGTGVMFLFGLSSEDEVRAALAPLPLHVAGLMTFELIPLGPLSPLAMLLK